MKLGQTTTQDAAGSDWHVTIWNLFLEFLITVLVADVVHPFKGRCMNICVGYI